MNLSLVMIVRDSSRTLEPCLRSIQPWVDEIVVVDTGSTDNTPDIARQYGARLFHFPWCDDFARARNESISHARGEWVFWMDSDDTIDAENGRKLRELAQQSQASSTLGHVMQVHCPGSDEDHQTEVTVVDHVKMFRNRPELRFEGRIHEQILPAIRRLGGEVAWSDIYVVHSGSDHSPEGQKRKQQRDLRLLHLELDDRPDHPFALFNVGMTLADMDEHEKAVEALRRCLVVSNPSESHVRKAYALLVGSYAQIQQHDAAQKVCQQGRQLFPRDAELLFREGILAHHFGRLEDAERAYQSILHDTDERHFSSIDRGICGFKARHNLAMVYTELGKLGLAELQWRQAADEVPHYRPAWRGLGDVLMRQNKYVTAQVEADKMVKQQHLRSEGRMLKAELAEKHGNLDEARRELDEATQEFSGDLDLLRRRCRFLFETAQFEEAQAALRELIARDPTDASAHHNLGTVCACLQRFTMAADAYQNSLRLRPSSSTCRAQLSQALQHLGKTTEASEYLREGERLASETRVEAPALG